MSCVPTLVRQLPVAHAYFLQIFTSSHESFQTLFERFHDVVFNHTITAKHHQVRTKLFSPHSRYVPTYGSSQSGLCNKVWAISTGGQVQQLAYQSKPWVSPTYETARTQRSLHVSQVQLIYPLDFSTVTVNVFRLGVNPRRVLRSHAAVSVWEDVLTSSLLVCVTASVREQ